MELTASEVRENVESKAVEALEKASGALGEVWELTDDKELLFALNAIQFTIYYLKGKKA